MISKILYFNKDKKIPDVNYDKILLRLKNDYTGWIYCIESEILNVYGKKYVIVDVAKNDEEIMKEMKKYPRCKLIKKINLDTVNCYNEILKLNLFNIRVENKFYNDKTLVKKELKKIEKIKSLDDYYKLLLININTVYNHINTYFKIRRKYIPTYKLCEKKNKNIINKKENTIDSIINYKSEIRKNGFLVELESEEIKYYYENKIKLIMGLSRYDEKDNMLIGDINVLNSIRIYDYELGILILRDQLKNELYDTNLYISNNKNISSIFIKIKKYFDEYDDYKKITSAYLYNEYKIGKNIKPDVKETVKNIEWIETPKEQILKKQLK
jgi:hypothetical protein